MRVSEVISKPTYNSGRTLLAASFLPTSSRLMQFGLDQLPLLSAPNGLNDATLATLSAVLIAFLLVSHSLNWLSDRTAFILDFQYATPKMRDHIENMLRDTVKLHESGSEVIGPEFDAMVSELQKRRIPFDRLSRLTNWSTWVSLHLQHLAFPLAIGAYAIWLLAPSVATVISS
ncbi:hypothetical protein FZX02_04705 [Synechococcus sp. MU1644]|nr:hypothetical protein [Synechococcus sp. MU1644]